MESSDFYDFSAPQHHFWLKNSTHQLATTTTNLYSTQRFSSSSSVSDMGLDELPSDTCNPSFTFFVSDDDFDQDFPWHDSLDLDANFLKKPRPPSYLEHLLWNEPLDNFNNKMYNDRNCNLSYGMLPQQTNLSDLHCWSSFDDVCAESFHTGGASFPHRNYSSDESVTNLFDSLLTAEASQLQNNKSLTETENFSFPPQDFEQSISNLTPLISTRTVKPCDSSPAPRNSDSTNKEGTTWAINHLTNPATINPHETSNSIRNDIPSMNNNNAYCDENQIFTFKGRNILDVSCVNVQGRLRPILNHFGSQNVGSTHVQLWQFLLELLANPELADGCIQWEGGEGEFRMVDPEEVARKWGKRKRRSRMNFEKMGRALRYYYDKLILKKVAGKKWTYQFNLAGILCQGKRQLQECFEKFERTHQAPLKSRA